MAFDPVVIGEIFPFEKPDPDFVGDSVKTAFDKLNVAVSDLESGGGGAGAPTPPNQYIDAAPPYTTFFADGTANGWVSATGTLVPDSVEPFGLWTTGTSDYLKNDGLAIDTKRFTHLIAWVELVSTGYVPAQKGSYKNGSHAYDFTGYGVSPTGDPVALSSGTRSYVAFDLSVVSDWFSIGSTGLAFKLSDTPGDVFKIWGLKLVGPNSSEVQTASTQAAIAQTLAEAAATASQTYRDAAEAFKDSASTYADNSQGYASDAQGFRDAAQNYRDESQQFSIDSSNNSLVATAAGRFAHYLEPLTNGTFTFPTGTGSFTSNGTLTNSAGKLRATVASLNGYVQTPNMDFDGTHFSKIMVRMTWISGTLDPTQPFKDCWLYYNTTTRATMSASFEMRPQAWEVLQLNGANVVNLYFDATEQAGISDDWFGPDPIRALRLYPAIATSSWVADIEYFYVLGDNVNYPYLQAQASATSAADAAAFENSAQSWAAASQTSATNAATSAGAASVSEGNAATSEASASGWATTAQSYAVLSAQASPGLQMTLNPVFMDWTAVATLPTGMASANSTSATISKNILNNLYSPQCLDITTTTAVSTSFTLNLASAAVPSKIVPIDNQYYVYEGVMELVSGSFTNILIQLVKTYTDTTTSTFNFVTNADFTAASNGRYTCSKLFSAPTTGGKTLANVTLLILPNNPTAANKRILVHKHVLRIATADEVAANTVQTTIDASVATEAALRVSGDGAINAKYTVKINANGYVAGYGLILDANNATPVSEMVFQVDKFKVSDAGQTPKQMFAVGAVNGVTTMVLNGNMVADGSITARKLVIADSDNLIPDAIFKDTGSWTLGDAAYSIATWTPSTWQAERGVLFTSAGGSGYTNESYGRPFAVQPSKLYNFTFQTWCDGTTPNNLLVRVFFYTAAPVDPASNGYLSYQDLSISNAAAGIINRSYDITTPATAVYARIAFYINKTNTVSGKTFAFSTPKFRSKIGGELIVDGAITAAKMSVTDLSAISANLGSITVDTAHIANLSVTTLKIADQAVTKPYYVEDFTAQTTSGTTWYSKGALSIPWTGGPFLGNMVIEYSTSTGTSTVLELAVEYWFNTDPMAIGVITLSGLNVTSSSSGAHQLISISYSLLPPAMWGPPNTVNFRLGFGRFSGTGSCTVYNIQHLNAYFAK